MVAPAPAAASSAPAAPAPAPHPAAGARTTVATSPAGKATSSLIDKMKRQLQGARFRWINEQMYTTDSKHSVDIFSREPELFRVVHPRRHRTPRRVLG